MKKKNILKKYKVFVFDWDGTLFDSMPIKIKNLGFIFSKRFRKKSTLFENSYREYSGLPRRKLFKKITLKVLGRNLKNAEFLSLSREFTQINFKTLSKSGCLFNSAKRILNKLRSLKRKIIISSSSPQDELDWIIKKLNVSNYIDEIMGSRPNFSKGKDHILYLLRKYKITKQEIIFIGNEINDIKLAKEAGICVGVVARSKNMDVFIPFKPDFIFDNLRSLENTNGRSNS